MDERDKIITLISWWARQQDDARLGYDERIHLNFHPQSDTFKALQSLCKDSDIYVSFIIVGREYHLRCYDCGGVPRLLKGNELANRILELTSEEGELAESLANIDAAKKFVTGCKNAERALLEICKTSGLKYEEEIRKKFRGIFAMGARICKRTNLAKTTPRPNPTDGKQRSSMVS